MLHTSTVIHEAKFDSGIIHDTMVKHAHILFKKNTKGGRHILGRDRDREREFESGNGVWKKKIK